ncbi:MAG: FAD-dependent oxidoreductase [Dysgonamonadaceae bacterium]|nr:FAD-dependent oxidoreductase [Dysgonamonadaceae bacterium]
MRYFIPICMFVAWTMNITAAEYFLEAENFADKGGWVVDQQFMDIMGSPYLMAHGMGMPVADASTQITLPEAGVYNVYVRTFNWTSPWKEGEGAGKFGLSVAGKRLATPLGTKGTSWMWQSAGKVKIRNTRTTVALHDLSGFNGRCDAVYFTTEDHQLPPEDVKALDTFRRKMLRLPETPDSAGNFDFVVVGGGIAGMCAAIAASRLDCRVALINDRPVLGGNNSSEIRVHLGGRIEIGPYKELGNLQKEWGPSRGGNAQPADFYEDHRKAEAIAREKNITLFSNYRAFAVNMNGQKIQSVIAKHIETGKELVFTAPVFADCTGDGVIGYLAGADYRTGRESRDEYGESTAPEKADKMTMGASVQWYSVETDKTAAFPRFNYGVVFNEHSCEKVTMGEWTWETGMHSDQIEDFERIRDYGLMVAYSNWSFLKNDLKDNTEYQKRKLAWVAYLSGKRESRRLMGDYVLKEDDLRKNVFHEDGTAATTWSIDLHYPDPQNTAHFPGKEFKSIAKHIPVYPYPVPYRCLYSRNVANLFMAGRNISVTHVALGTTRVMRTTGMLGEVVGMAASLCMRYKASPRDVYQRYLNELKCLMQAGVGKKGLPNNQQYNMGRTLKQAPELK